MTDLRSALKEAMSYHRAAAVRYTTLRGFEAIELQDFDLMGRIDFVIPENGDMPIPQNGQASEALANILYEAIGGSEWYNKCRPPALGPAPKAKPKKFKLRR